MKKLAIDTNIAIDILNGKQNTIEVLQKYDVYYLPITVCGELLYGAMNSKKSNSNLRKFRAFIKSCKILNSNAAIAEEYATVRLKLRQAGTPIPENDIWIAAICNVNKIPLATRDDHFRKVEELRLLMLTLH